MSTETRDFHFNVNVRLNSGSKASMANNEDSFLRAMEIQERKREKKELEKLEEEKIAVAQAPVESAEPVTSPEETPTVQEEAPGSANAHAEPAPTAQAEAADTPPATPAEPPAPKPAGGNVPTPQPPREFTAEEKAAMLKRAKAHAAEVRARKK